LLAPVPPADKILSNWKQALQNINARSVDLATAVQEVEKAEGSWRSALSNALPTLTAAGQATQFLLYNPAQIAGAAASNNPIVSGAVTAWVPVIAASAWFMTKQASVQATSAKLSLEDKKRTIFAGVANAIVAVFTAERVAEVNRSGLRNALEQLDITRRQYKIGTATRLDVLRVEQDAATARGTLLTGDESLRQARESLGLALGFHEAWGVPPGISIDEVEGTLKSICAPGPLANRADIRKAKNDIEAAHVGVNAVWAEFAPFFSVASTAAVYNYTQATTSGGNYTWNLSGVLTFPLWDGGARYGLLRVAKAVEEEAKLTLESTVRSADIALLQAARGVAVNEQEREVSANAHDLAVELSRLTLRQFQVGTATSLDLVNAAQQERATALDLAIKEFNVINAKIAAVLATADCNY